jgi:hypothetical protein
MPRKYCSQSQKCENFNIFVNFLSQLGFSNFRLYTLDIKQKIDIIQKENIKALLLIRAKMNPNPTVELDTIAFKDVEIDTSSTIKGLNK